MQVKTDFMFNFRQTSVAVVLLLLLGFSACKKDDTGPSGSAADTDLKTENLRLLNTSKDRPNGNIRFLSINEMDATADGNIHLFYQLNDAGGGGTYFRRILGPSGDSIGAPEIHPDVVDIAINHGVADNWAFAQGTGQLTLSYHPDQTYDYRLYVVDDPALTYTFTDASFGGLPWATSNGDRLAAYGYSGYFSNQNVLQSQGFFTWFHNGQTSKYVELHTVPYLPVYEDKLRRAFAAEPLGDGRLAMGIVDGTQFYLKIYDPISQTATLVDSLATTELQNLDRIIFADASMEARTSEDGLHILFFIQHETGGSSTDQLRHYATFAFNKATQKLEKQVTGLALPYNVFVNSDEDGNLFYATLDDPNHPSTWTVYRFGADGNAEEVAHLSATSPSNLVVGEVKPMQGKVFVSAYIAAYPTSTKGPFSFLFELK